MTFKKQRFQQKGFNSSACHIYGTFLLSLLFKKKMIGQNLKDYYGPLNNWG